jgi:DNA-binding NtrC family response regulator
MVNFFGGVMAPSQRTPAAGSAGPSLTDVTKPILVVDDDPAVLGTVADLLELEGHRVERAGNGREALEAVERRRPCLVLLDMRMPLVDGWAFARELKAREIDLPIIVMTAAQDAAAWAEQIGAAAVLAKPFDVDNLLDTVERLRMAP